MHYYRQAKNYRVHSVIFTRGEGGQNEVGPELYEALGAIRSEETEKAARNLGTQVHFLNFYDFGYSKTAEETFEAWGGREKVTAELVHIIRRLRPDVIFTNHDTLTVGPARQHGHHQAVGIAAYDAFALAANSGFYPEQLEASDVEVWQPKRLYLRHWRKPESYDATVPVGDLDPASGDSYAAGAASALGFHASQGMGQFAERIAGLSANYFSLLRSVDTPPAGGDLFAALVPQASLAPHISYLIDSGRIEPLSPDLLTVDDALVVRGQEVSLTWPATEDARLELTGALDTVLTTSPLTLRIPRDAHFTRPSKVYQYGRQKNHPPVVYKVFEDDVPAPAYAGYLPLHIAPPVHIEPANAVVRLRPGDNQVPYRVHVFDEKLEEIPVSISVSSQGSALPLYEGTARLTAQPKVNGSLSVPLPGDLSNGDYAINVRGPGDAGFSIVGRVFDVQAAPGLKVGVVASYDDTLPAALEALGVDFVMLDSMALATAAFEGLHTIVLDIRSYLVRTDLRQSNDALIGWVHGGGHLMVNYHKTFEWNSQDGSSLAPLRLELGRSRVTREDAPVRVQNPSHPVMRWPNVIGPDAWDGWVQERGLYFPETWDPAYEELFCMNDPGEPSHCGSTLLASIGQGTYLYTALGWYRQLKVHHPGAYALFANMISLPRARHGLSNF